MRWVGELPNDVAVPVTDIEEVSDPFSLVRTGVCVPDLDISVFGTPAPQGSKVPGGRTKEGRITMRESSKKVTPWREAVGESFQRFAGWDEDSRQYSDGWPITGPLIVEMVFTMPKPAASPKKRVTYPANHRNDVSKLARSTEDSLVDFGAIEDDGMIIEYVRLAKVFPNEDRDALPVPGAVIRVWSVSRLVPDQR